MYSWLGRFAPVVGVASLAATSLACNSSSDGHSPDAGCLVSDCSDSGAVSKDSGAVSKDSGAVSKDSGAVSKDSGAVSDSGAKPQPPDAADSGGPPERDADGPDPCAGLKTLQSLHITRDDTAQDVADRVRCVERIEGQLYLDWVSMASLDFERLQHAGSIRIQGGAGLQRVTFDGLRSMGGEISVQAMRSLTHFSIPSLVEIDEHESNGIDPVAGVRIVDNRALQTLDFAGLERVGALAIRENPVLTTLAFPVLKSVVGTFATEACDIFESGVFMQFNDNLSEVDLGALEIIERGGFRLRDSATITELRLPRLVSVGAQFGVSNNLQLSQVFAPLLDTARGLWINNNPSLAQSTVTKLEAQTGLSCLGEWDCVEQVPCDGNLTAMSDADAGQPDVSTAAGSDAGP